MGRKVGKKASKYFKFVLNAMHWNKNRNASVRDILGVSKHQYKNYLRSKANDSAGD